jgi:hypothetical protein
MMKAKSIKRNLYKSALLWTTMVPAIFLLSFQPTTVKGGTKSPPPEKIKAIIIGDRVVDIAYNLGVMPAAMSVRGSLWPMAKKLGTVSEILGCPRCIVLKKELVPRACTKYGVRRLIVEKSHPFCLYKPEVKPENIVPLMTETDLIIQYVDFSNGLDQAVRQTAKLLDREFKAHATIETYKRELAAAEKRLPKQRSGKRVIIFKGVYQSATGKLMLSVEAPGAYADRFLLERLGCVNVGDCFETSSGGAQKGHYTVRKKKDGMALDPVIGANPDVIIMTGDAFAVQKAFSDYQGVNPAFARVKAIREMAVYTLPAYVDSSVLEYPSVLHMWTIALGR